MILRERQPAGDLLAFGPFRFAPAHGVLTEGETPVRLGGRALALLSALLERPGEVCSRMELEARLWPNTTVEDSSLRVHVAALRRSLGDGTNGRRYIANVPGRGYSFVAPVARIVALEPALPPGRPRALPPARAPARVHAFVGREDDIARVTDCLVHGRLCSIVGHGGIGKTALALVLAERLRPAFEDGVCFVDLAPLSEPAHVLPALAAGLGLDPAGEQPSEALVRALDGRRMLVVLDNCEHVIEAAVLTAMALLAASDGIRVLVTSREPLDVDGEAVHRIAPLESPPAGRQLECAQALAFPALRLLVERARTSVESFTLDDTNLDAAIAVCRRVDGVPLAIEFAAARIGLLGAGAVAAQLDDRLGLLGSGRRTAVPRHRTLRALLDWSHDLLGPSEQATLARCAVFRGAFTLDMAIDTLADETFDGEAVANSLLGLVDKSLVTVASSGADPLFSLLGITHVYALERLDARGEGDRLAARHAACLLRLMRDANAEWEHMAAGAWRASHLRTLNNLRAALEWAFGPRGDAALGVEITAHMRHVALAFMRPDETRRHALRAQSAIAAGAPVEPLHEVWIYNLLYHGADVAVGCAPRLPPGHVQALDDAVRAHQHERQVEVLYHMFTYAFGGGDYPLADDCAARATQVARTWNDDAALLHCARIRAQSSHFLGRHGEAADLASTVLARAGDKVPLPYASSIGRRLSMNILAARIHWLRGEDAQARAAFAAAEEAAHTEEHPNAPCQLLALAAIPLAIWRGEPAAALVARLQAHADADGLEYWSLWARRCRMLADPDALRQAVDAGEEAKLFDHLATFDAASLNPATYERAERGLSGWCAPEVFRARGEQLLAGQGGDAATQAERLFRRALALARDQAAVAWELRAALSLARLWHDQGRDAAAAGLLRPFAALPVDSADMRAAAALLARPC